MKTLLPLATAAASAAALCVAVPAATTAPAPTPTLTRTSLGKITLGMSVAQATRASGIRFTVGDPSNPYCRYARATDRRLGVWLMLTRRGQVARFDVSRPAVTTSTTVGVGSTEAAVVIAYPKAITRPHKYVRRGHEIWVGARPGARSGAALVFETDGKRVTHVRAGKLPQVGYVEGCS